MLFLDEAEIVKHDGITLLMFPQDDYKNRDFFAIELTEIESMSEAGKILVEKYYEEKYKDEGV